VKSRLSLLALFAVLSTAAVCQPKAPQPLPTSVVTVDNSAGAVDCTYTLSFSGATKTSAAHVASATFTVPQSLVNADAATASCAGFVLATQAPASLLSNHVTLALTPIAPPPVPLPPAPTRDQIITAQNWGMQGETWSDATCTNGQKVPLWDPIITPMSADCRLAAYKRKHDVYGDRKVIIPIAWGYPEPGTALINVNGTDWTNDMPTVRARVLEAVTAGLYVDLNYAGDGASILTTSGACAWQEITPGYRDYGEQCAEALVPLVDAALLGDGSSHATGNLLPYVIKTLGWDGTFYGSATPDQVSHWSTVARASDSAAVLSMEFNVGHIPLGEGPGEYDPGGRMFNFDLVKGEFDPANQGYHNDATWQISGRLLCSDWTRPADMPAGDDANPPCYVSSTTPRGRIYVDDFENDTYCWVRLSCTIGDVVLHAQYMRSLGWALIDSPLSATAAPRTASPRGAPASRLAPPVPMTWRLGRVPAFQGYTATGR
jgi:hypothetical protein